MQIIQLISFLIYNGLTPSNYNLIKQSIYRNIEHEVIHLGQYIFKHFKNIEFGGMPSKQISNPEYTPEGQQTQTYEEKEHSLRDIEFYAILNDAKIELKKQLEKWPEDMHDSIFRRFVGTIPSFQKLRSAPQQFFLNLKEYEPEKWQKAVKELYKTIKEANMYISKRAQVSKEYIVLLQPTETQLEHFTRQQGIPYDSFDDRPRPDRMPAMISDKYDDAIENAFQFALQSFKDLAKQNDFEIISDELDYVMLGNGKIIPATLTIKANPYVADKLKNNALVRGVSEAPTINEVYI